MTQQTGNGAVSALLLASSVVRGSSRRHESVLTSAAVRRRPRVTPPLFETARRCLCRPRGLSIRAVSRRDVATCLARLAWHASPQRRAGGRGSAVEGGDEAVEVVVARPPAARDADEPTPGQFPDVDVGRMELGDDVRGLLAVGTEAD